MPILPYLLVLVAAMIAGALAGWQVTRRFLRRGLDRLTRQLELAQQEARTDSLTGLWNRKAFDEQLAIQSAISRRYRLPLTLILLDADHFKQVNDTHGHAAGDQVLRELARRLKSSVRDADFVSRFGGEEFALLLPQTNLEGGLQVAERTRARIAATPLIDAGTAINVTISVGVAALQSDETATAMLRRADSALYRAKQSGRNRVSAADEAREPAGQPQTT